MVMCTKCAPYTAELNLWVGSSADPSRFCWLELQIFVVDERDLTYESIPERVSDLLQDLEDYQPEQGTYQPDS